MRKSIIVPCEEKLTLRGVPDLMIEWMPFRQEVKHNIGIEKCLFHEYFFVRYCSSGSLPLTPCSSFMIPDNSLTRGERGKAGAWASSETSMKKCSTIFEKLICQLLAYLRALPPDAIGGMNLDTFEYFAKGSVKNDEAFLSTSQARLIANPKGNGHVYNYVKIKI